MSAIKGESVKERQEQKKEKDSFNRPRFKKAILKAFDDGGEEERGKKKAGNCERK